MAVSKFVTWHSKFDPSRFLPLNIIFSPYRTLRLERRAVTNGRRRGVGVGATVVVVGFKVVVVTGGGVVVVVTGGVVVVVVGGIVGASVVVVVGSIVGASVVVVTNCVEHRISPYP
jgi:hypothetical protein